LKRRIQTPRKSLPQKGQSLVELALTITIVLTLLAGAFDLGSAFFSYIALRDAAQEGAVYGSIDPTHKDLIETRVRLSSTAPINFSSFAATCSTTSPKGSCVELRRPDGTIPAKPCTGDQVIVTVRYTYTLLMPFIGGIIGRQTIPLKATVTNVILTPLCAP
jgi:Flp pilus assembly protein TadG